MDRSYPLCCAPGQYLQWYSMACYLDQDLWHLLGWLQLHQHGKLVASQSCLPAPASWPIQCCHREKEGDSFWTQLCHCAAPNTWIRRHSAVSTVGAVMSVYKIEKAGEKRENEHLYTFYDYYKCFSFYLFRRPNLVSKDCGAFRIVIPIIINTLNI